MGRHDTVHLRVGKHGLTDGLIEEINAQLEHTDELRIKLLQSFREAEDRKEAAAELAERTDSTVSELVGGTLVLTRKH